MPGAQKPERNPFDSIQIVLPRKQCRYERISGQEEDQQKTGDDSHRRLVQWGDEDDAEPGQGGRAGDAHRRS